MTYEPLWLEGYGHNNMPTTVYAEHVLSFLSALRNRRKAGIA